MREIIILTMGTRGDVQPYIYLAQMLEQAKVYASIGSHPCWRSLVEKSGIEFDSD